METPDSFWTYSITDVDLQHGSPLWMKILISIAAVALIILAIRWVVTTLRRGNVTSTVITALTSVIGIAGIVVLVIAVFGNSTPDNLDDMSDNEVTSFVSKTVVEEGFTEDEFLDEGDVPTIEELSAVVSSREEAYVGGIGVADMSNDTSCVIQWSFSDTQLGSSLWVGVEYSDECRNM